MWLRIIGATLAKRNNGLAERKGRSIGYGSRLKRTLVLSHFEFEGFRTVMPAQAGIQGEQAAASDYSAWIPAFAGMTQHSSTPQNHHDRLLGSSTFCCAPSLPLPQRGRGQG